MISATDIVKQSKDLYKENFGTFLKYFILSLIIGGLGQAIATVAPATESISLIVLGIVVAIAVMLIQFWVRITFSKVIANLGRKQHDQGIKKEMADSKNIFWKAIGVTVWIAVLAGWPIIILAIISGILPAIGISSSPINMTLGILGIAAMIYSVYMGIKLVFAYFGVIVDKMEIQEAISFSKEKVSGNWWGVLWRLIAPTLLAGIALMIVNGILMGVGSLTESMALFGVMAFMVFVISFLSLPLFKAFPVVLYNDIKVGNMNQQADRVEDKAVS